MQYIALHYIMRRLSAQIERTPPPSPLSRPPPHFMTPLAAFLIPVRRFLECPPSARNKSAFLDFRCPLVEMLTPAGRRSCFLLSEPQKTNSHWRGRRPAPKGKGQPVERLAQQQLISVELDAVGPR
jgi:hypothetical protein